jgi:hypothetical protein
MGRATAPVLFFFFAPAEAVLLAHESSDLALARSLANAATQEKTVEGLVASRGQRLALLLSWTENPPPEMNVLEQAELDAAMAEVFGRLRTTAAIPFLIRKISLQHLPATPNVWTKTAVSVRERAPAVGALIAIGPDAEKAVIHTPREEMTFEERLAATIVVSQIGTTPDAREYLLSVLKSAGRLEQYWAEEGLKRLNGTTAPKN